MPVVHDCAMLGSAHLGFIQHSDHLSEAKEDQSNASSELLHPRDLTNSFQNFILSLLLEVGLQQMDRLQSVRPDAEVCDRLSAILDQCRADLPDQVQLTADRG